MAGRCAVRAAFVGLAAWGLAGAAGAQPAGPHAPVDVAPSGPSLDARLAEIQRLIQEALVYPPIERKRGAAGEALVAFHIDSAGRAASIELARSTGHPLLDRAALRAVAAAGPLPYVYGRLEVPVRFQLDAER
jgi:periplasmic protein TonB